MRFRASRRPVGDTRWPRSWPEVPFREHICSDGPHSFPPPTLQCLYLAVPSYMGDMGAGKGWLWDLPSGKPCFRDLWDVGTLCLDPAQPHAFGCPVALRVITATPGGGRRTSGSSLRPRQCARCSTAEPGSLSPPVFMAVLRPASCPMLQRSNQRLPKCRPPAQGETACQWQSWAYSWFPLTRSSLLDKTGPWVGEG